jgi:hypothetical protein
VSADSRGLLRARRRPQVIRVTHDDPASYEFRARRLVEPDEALADYKPKREALQQAMSAWAHVVKELGAGTRTARALIQHLKRCRARRNPRQAPRSAPDALSRRLRWA